MNTFKASSVAGINSSSKTTTNFVHTMPDDLKSLLAENTKLNELWNKLTPLAQNEWMCYVTIVKKAETRQAHLERLESDILSGEKRPCCWPGCPHRRPNAAKWFGKKQA